MPPPDLPADAPVLDVLQPLRVSLLPVVRDQANAARAHGVKGRAGDGGHAAGAAVRLHLAREVHVPLVGQIRLDDGAGAIPARHHQRVVLHRVQQAGGFEVGDDLFARFVTVEAAISRRRLVVDARVGRHHVDLGQPVALADGEVVEIVRRGDLDAAGAERRVDVLVRNDRNLPIAQRQANGVADQVPVALVVRVHRHGAVAEQRFRARGGDGQMPAAVRERVADVPQVAALFLADHLQIRDGGLQHRVPVDQALAAVNETLLVQAHEGFRHRRRQAGVHGEALARPVAGGAEPPQLAGDGAAGLGLPLPYAVQKRLAAQIVAGLSLRGELALDHHLRGDAGVVGAHLPQRVPAAHARVADQQIHHRVVEGVAHVQAAGHIWRRDHDAVGLALAARLEMAAVFPALVPALFDGLRVVGLVHGAAPAGGAGSGVGWGGGQQVAQAGVQFFAQGGAQPPFGVRHLLR